MREISRPDRAMTPPTKGRPLATAKPPSVASLGVRVRLVPVARDRELARLIRSCDALRTEWECLFQRIVELLNEDDRGSRGDGLSSSPDE